MPLKNDMTPDRAHIGLAHWVENRFQTGFLVDRHQRAFMEQTFGASDLQTVLTDMDSSETAPFVELLFYPDQADRIAYETHWGDQRFTVDRRDALIDELTRLSLPTQLHIAGEQTSIQMVAPPFAVAAFVQHLNIDWAPPERLSEYTINQLSPRERAWIGAKLRSTRVIWQAQRIDVAVRFLNAMPFENDGFTECFEFLLSIIGEFEPDRSPFAFLMEKKQSYFQALCRLEAFERRLKTTNMETLMLQGERAAHGSSDQWRWQMRMIDKISETLFGKTQFFQQPRVEERTVDSSGDEGAIAQVIRLLD